MQKVFFLFFFLSAFVYSSDDFYNVKSGDQVMCSPVEKSECDTRHAEFRRRLQVQKNANLKLGIMANDCEIVGDPGKDVPEVTEKSHFTTMKYIEEEADFMIGEFGLIGANSWVRPKKMSCGGLAKNCRRAGWLGVILTGGFYLKELKDYYDVKGDCTCRLRLPLMALKLHSYNLKYCQSVDVNDGSVDQDLKLVNGPGETCQAPYLKPIGLAINDQGPICQWKTVGTYHKAAFDPTTGIPIGYPGECRIVGDQECRGIDTFNLPGGEGDCSNKGGTCIRCYGTNKDDYYGDDDFDNQAYDWCALSGGNSEPGEDFGNACNAFCQERYLQPGGTEGDEERRIWKRLKYGLPTLACDALREEFIEENYPEGFENSTHVMVPGKLHHIEPELCPIEKNTSAQQPPP